MIMHLGRASIETKGPLGSPFLDSMDPKGNTNRTWLF
jgi:hypothetical protein